MEQKNHGSPSFINIAVLLLFAVVIAVVSAVTTYFVLNSRSNEQYSAGQPSIIPQAQTNVLPITIPTTPIQTVPDETAGWKVYTSIQYNYTIQYPMEWIIGLSKNQTLLYLTDNQSYIDLSNGKSAITPSTGFKATIFINEITSIAEDVNVNDKNSILKFIGGREALPLIEEKYITVNTLPAYRRILQTKGQITRTDVEYNYFKNNKLYSIWFEIDTRNDATLQAMINLFDRVASTFKAN